jgi:hypothetical protein
MQQKTREAVHARDREQCVNCGRTGPETTLDVHHIVPRGKGGSNRLSNLALLCRQCNDAVHGDETAPTVQFASTGDMTTDSFATFLQFFNELPSARFDSDSKVWQVPKADFERVLDSMGGSDESIAVTDGGDG